MRRRFEVDVLVCPRRGGRLRLVALLEACTVTARILRHLGLPSEVPAAHPARALVCRSAGGLSSHLWQAPSPALVPALRIVRVAIRAVTGANLWRIPA